MVGFSDLPDELVMEILDHIDTMDGRQDMFRNLCLVSRRFDNTARSYLYRSDYFRKSSALKKRTFSGCEVLVIVSVHILIICGLLFGFSLKYPRTRAMSSSLMYSGCNFQSAFTDAE
ncbi:MAG: F-box domain-containing protein [Pedobacter sp.]|nr:MAG: F-box domain-containing protein [Pedobacter sp.]